MLPNVVIPHQQSWGDSLFPFALDGTGLASAGTDLSTWITTHRAELLELSTQHGAVLCRNFPIGSIADFDALVVALGVENFPYRQSLSNAVRVNKTERVFTANEAPPTAQILFHHEMAQTPLFPEHILFYCEQSAATGGATPICRSDILYERLAIECPEFLSRCEQKGLKYTNVMPDENDAQSGQGRSWRSTLGVDSRAAAEERLRALNYCWDWQPDGSLRATTPILPAVMDVGNGRKTFFNQIIAAYCGWKDTRNDPSSAVRHGDDTPLDGAAVLRAAALADELAFDVAWQNGDVTLIDNRIAMHARRTFSGTRKVLASLANMRRHAFEQPVGR